MMELPVNPNKFYLPLARSSCRVALTFSKKKIVAIEPGEAFDAAEWKTISKEIEESILAGPLKVGREYSFSSFRVTGSWRGAHSGVQILPPPKHSPRANVEMADHPFILEFPMKATDCWPVTNHRRIRKHRSLTILLNVLLAGHTSFQSNRPAHFWASVPCEDGRHESQWLQRFFTADLGKPVIDQPSPPADLDHSICCYMGLSSENRAKFDRAAFWMDMAWQQWTIAVSASFTSLVSAVESLTDRGTKHRIVCEQCKSYSQHEVPGATERFRAFFETYAPSAVLKRRRNEMYLLRSGILHGGELMQLDQALAFGWEPPWWNERELHDELWGLTRLALRNWLKNLPAP